MSNGLVNKHLDLDDEVESRRPSPQPTHLNVPGRPPPRNILHEKGSGYVAPKFEGKDKQMEKYASDVVESCSMADLLTLSLE